MSNNKRTRPPVFPMPRRSSVATPLPPLSLDAVGPGAGAVGSAVTVVAAPSFLSDAAATRSTGSWKSRIVAHAAVDARTAAVSKERFTKCQTAGVAGA